MKTKNSNSIKIKRLILIPIIVLLFACDMSKINSKTQVVDLSKFNVKDIREVLKLDTVILLETSEKSLIGDVFKIIIDGNYVFVVDSRITNSVYAFNQDGQFQFKIDSKNVNEEKILISDVIYNEFSNSIDIYDGKNIIKYDLEGNQLKKIDIGLPCHNFVALNESVYAIYSNKTEKINLKEYYDLNYVNQKGEVIASFLSYNPSYYTDGSSNARVSNNHRFAIRQVGHSTFLGEFYNDTIYWIGKNSIDPQYIIQHSNSIPKEMRMLPHRELIRRVDTEGYNHGSHIFFENNDILLILSIESLQNNIVKYFMWDKKEKSATFLDDPDRIFQYPVSMSQGKLYSFQHPYQMSASEMKKYGLTINSNPVILVYKIIE